MPLLIALITFGILMLVFLVAYSILANTRNAVRGRLTKYLELPVENAIKPGPIIGNSSQLSSWRELVREFGKYFEWSPWSKVMEQKLVQAGLPLRGGEFAVVCIGAVGLFGILLFVLSGGRILFGLAGGIMGHLIPVFFVRYKINQRAKAFNQQLGDGLILIANSLRTGYSFMQSIEMVSREMPAPISAEFGRTLKEINLGVTTENAMNNLARRIDSEDLDLVVTAVLIQRQIGGNLAEILDNIAGTIRARVKLRGEVKTLTAQGRISGWIVSLLPLAMGIMLYSINPEYLKILFVHPVGMVLVGGAILGQILGLYCIRKIVQIDL